MSVTSEWTTDDVCKKVRAELALENEDDYILNKIRENNIIGSTLSEITLKDCKELCPDVISAVQLKTCFNKLIDTEKQAPEQELVLTMKGLHQTLSEKLQEFQSNYAQLRLDLLEIVRRNNGSGPVPVQPQVQQISSQENLDRTAHHPNVPTSPKYKSNSGNSVLPANNRSTSSSSHMASITPNTGVSSAPSSEPMKQLRASKEDSCEKVLRNAMKRHNLNEADWKQHVLVICYGDQERILELDEKPVQIFKTLRQQGLHPAIMLRQKGDFEEIGEMAATPGGRL